MMATMSDAKDETYNGWTNRETWVVNLWLSNDEDTYKDAREIAMQSLADGREYASERGWTIDQTTGLGLVAERLEQFVDDLAAEEYDKATMLSDLITSALARVDWMELVKAWTEEA